MVGAAVGGALVVAAAMALAIRLRVVSAQINGHKVQGWRSGSKKAKRIPEMDINTNQTIINNPSVALRVRRMNDVGTPVSASE